jgi:hypothetical protein
MEALLVTKKAEIEQEGTVDLPAVLGYNNLVLGKIKDHNNTRSS